MFGFGSRGRFKSVKQTMKVKSRGFVYPPASAVMAALMSVLGDGKGIPVTYMPSPGVEVRLGIIVVGDPRVREAHNYLYLGDTAVFRTQVSTYTVIMPPKPSTAENVNVAVREVIENVLRWEKLLFIIAQAPMTAVPGVILSSAQLKKPWLRKGSEEVGFMPPPDIFRVFGEELRFDSVVGIIDGVRVDGISNKSPDYEIGYAVIDEDVTTVVYGLNPSAVRTLLQRQEFRRVTISSIEGAMEPALPMPEFRGYTGKQKAPKEPSNEDYVRQYTPTESRRKRKVKKANE